MGAVSQFIPPLSSPFPVGIMVLLTWEEDDERVPRWSQECGGARASFGSLEKQHRCRCPAAAGGALFWDLGRRWFCFSHFMWRKAALPLVSLLLSFFLSIATISGCKLMADV